jgi:hypothetical protein
MREAISDYTRARTQGVSRVDAIKGLEACLRDAWPGKTSKFSHTCDACEDTGYLESMCWEQERCGRQRCALTPSLEHRYVTPCHCLRGQRMTQRVRQVEDHLAAVGRRKAKPRGFSRVGG